MSDYATLLRDRQALRVRSVDRIFVQGYVPKLQSAGQVCRFLVDKGYRIPSSAAFGQIGRRYVAGIDRFAIDHEIPVVRFKRGDRKESIARPFLDQARDRDPDRAQVVMIGVAQEKSSAWRSWVAKGQKDLPHPHMEWSRQSTFVNHYYFYVWDPDWGPGFIKTNAYAPFGIWIWVNGHEWAKRQCDRAGIGYTAMADSNGFAACDDPDALDRICHRLGPQMLTSFLWRYLFSPTTHAKRPTTSDDSNAKT
ncbi:MAG: hypothetical protein OEV40_31190 [Acidimicrobiia bacterium]|nr:hypothetical protein [Acidimicrobiia bacterium]